MKTYKSNEEVEKDIVNGVLIVHDNVTFDFDDCGIDADIIAWNTRASNISAWNIHAGHFYAGNIDALNLYTGSLCANNIDALDINATSIDASNISYYAVCFAHKDIYCRSIEGYIENSKHFSLYGKIIIESEVK